MKWFFLLILTMCGWLMDCLPAAAQQEDSMNHIYGSALTTYHRLLSPETGLYKGDEYLNYAHTIQEGTPFFDAVPFGTGSVVYHNILYENVFIAYDVVLDEVVIRDASHLHTLSLLSKEVSRFTTSGHHFIRLAKDSTSLHMRTGFYEVLYDGKIKVLKRYNRTIQERFTLQNTLERHTEGSVDYYLEKNDSYYPVNNKSLLLSALGDREKELKALLRKKRLKFRRNKDNSLIQAATYYDTITNQ